MACYKRKGYTYISGHYAKPLPAAIGEVGTVKTELTTTVPSRTVQLANPAAPQVPAPAGMEELPLRRSNEVTMGGVTENVIGSGIVAAGQYLFILQPLMDQVKQIHHKISVIERRLQPQQSHVQQAKQATGQSVKFGNQTITQPSFSAPLTPIEQLKKRMGLDSRQPPKFGSGISLM